MFMFQVIQNQLKATLLVFKMNLKRRNKQKKILKQKCMICNYSKDSIVLTVKKKI